MKRALLKGAAAAVMLAALVLPARAAQIDGTYFNGKADNFTRTEATPVNMEVTVFSHNGGCTDNVERMIPIYSIVQNELGWVSNYVKLRDIAYFVDFDVDWSPDEPDAMYIWTHRHYLEPLNTDMSVPLKTEIATKSTMRMFVDGVEVKDFDAMIINDNNYFKVRDLAKIINFGCLYMMPSRTYPNGAVGLNAQVPYKDGDLLFTDQNYPERRVVDYESDMWFDESSGEICDGPVEQLATDPWARENWYEEYASDELRAWVEEQNKPEYLSGVLRRYRDRDTWPSMFNAMVQLELDKDKIEADPEHYRYPLVNCGFIVCDASWNLGIGHTEINTNARISLATPSKVDLNDNRFIATNNAAADIIAKAATFKTEREKIEYLVDVICERMAYDGVGTIPGEAYENSYNGLVTGEFWHSGKKYTGVCAHYVEIFERLATCCDVKWMHMSDGDHTWDLVWLGDEGKWVVVDPTNVDPWNPSDSYEAAQRKELYLCVDLDKYNRNTNVKGQKLFLKEVMETASKVK